MKHPIRTTLVAVGAAAFMLMGTGCVGPRPEQQQIALQFEGGAVVKTARAFIRCVPGGQKGSYDSGGTTAFYPADQRFVDFTGGKGSDRGPIEVISKDGVPLAVPGQLQYYLNTDCGSGEGKEAMNSAIVQFDQQIARRANASFEEDNPSKIPEGWREVQKRYVETPLEAALDREALKYNWRDLIFDGSKRTQWQNDALKALPALINDNAPTDLEFWKNFQLLIQVPSLTGEAGKRAQDAIVEGQQRVAKAQADQAEADARAAAANAEIAVSQADAKKKAAEIAGYPDKETYLRDKAIEKGQNPFQPTIVTGGTLSAPAPAPAK